MITSIEGTTQETNRNVLEDDKLDKVLDEGRKRKAEGQLDSKITKVVVCALDDHNYTSKVRGPAEEKDEDQSDLEAHVVNITRPYLTESVTPSPPNTVIDSVVPIFSDLVDRFPDIDSLENPDDEEVHQLVPHYSEHDFLTGSSQPDLVVYSERTSDTLVGDQGVVRGVYLKRDSENED